jgi:hypothetical protein
MAPLRGWKRGGGVDTSARNSVVLYNPRVTRSIFQIQNKANSADAILKVLKSLCSEVKLHDDRRRNIEYLGGIPDIVVCMEHQKMNVAVLEVACRLVAELVLVNDLSIQDRMCTNFAVPRVLVVMSTHEKRNVGLHREAC